jgi:hypothetical protein
MSHCNLVASPGLVGPLQPEPDSEQELDSTLRTLDGNTNEMDDYPSLLPPQFIAKPTHTL